MLPPPLPVVLGPPVPEPGVVEPSVVLELPRLRPRLLVDPLVSVVPAEPPMLEPVLVLPALGVPAEEPDVDVPVEDEAPLDWAKAVVQQSVNAANAAAAGRRFMRGSWGSAADDSGALCLANAALHPHVPVSKDFFALRRDVGSATFVC